MKFMRNLDSTAAYQSQVKACFKLYKHDVSSSKAKTTSQIYGWVANFSGDFHFLPIPMFLCICAGQGVLVKYQCVKATRPREVLFYSQCFAALTKNTCDNAPINNLSSPRFHDRAALGNFQLFCLARSENHGLNEHQAPECQWHTAQIKLLRALGAGVAWNMPCAWVQGQASRADCQNVVSGHPRAQFPRAVLRAQRPEHTLHHLPALWALAFVIVSGGYRMSSYTVSEVYSLPTGNFQPWCGLVASLFC